MSNFAEETPAQRSCLREHITSDLPFKRRSGGTPPPYELLKTLSGKTESLEYSLEYLSQLR